MLQHDTLLNGKTEPDRIEQVAPANQHQGQSLATSILLFVVMAAHVLLLCFSTEIRCSMLFRLHKTQADSPEAVLGVPSSRFVALFAIWSAPLGCRICKCIEHTSVKKF